MSKNSICFCPLYRYVGTKERNETFSLYDHILGIITLTSRRLPFDIYIARVFIFISMYACTGWGNRSWTKTFFFSIYRTSCLIEAYGGPKKYWLVCGRLLANHPFNLNCIFLATAHRQWRSERQVLQMYSATNQSHYTLIDGCMASRLA